MVLRGVLILVVLSLLQGKVSCEYYSRGLGHEPTSVTLIEDTDRLKVLNRSLECPGILTMIEFSVVNPEPVPFTVTYREFFVDLYMTRPPDAELGDVYYDVLIECRDDDITTPPATATVSVTIISINEYSPYAPHDSYTIIISEGNRPGDVVGTVGEGDNQYLMLDDDGGADGELSFTLLDSPHPYFSVDYETGNIILKQELDYDLGGEFSNTIRIHGCDMATPFNDCPNASVTLILADANDVDPMFQMPVYSGVIKEGVHRGTDINITISCSDGDVGVGGYEGMEVVSSELGLAQLIFTSESTARLLLTGAMDYDSFNDTKFKVVIRCYDQSYNGVQRSSTATVEIEIIPVNEYTPQFSAEWYNTSVLETLPIGSLVLTLTCIDNDRDTGKLKSISLYRPSPLVNKTFNVNPHNGQMTLTAALDYDHPNNRSHIFSVQCIDDDGLEAVANVAILTLPASDEMLILETPFIFTVDRITEIDRRIGQIVAVDGDKGQDSVIIYSIQNNDLFEIDADEGYIILIDYLSGDKGSFFNLTVGARDNQGLVEGQVEITVVGSLTIIEAVNVAIGVVGVIVVIIIGVLVFVCGYFCVKLLRKSNTDEATTDITVSYIPGDKIPYQRRPVSGRPVSASSAGAKNARERSTLSLQRARKNKQPQRSFKKKARRRVGLDANVFENSLQRSRAAATDEDNTLSLDMTTFTSKSAMTTKMKGKKLAGTGKGTAQNIFNPEDAGLLLGDIMTFPGEGEQTRWGDEVGDLGSWGLVEAEISEEETPAGLGQWSPTSDETITLID